MAKQTIDLDVANSGGGDGLRTGGVKINANFDELYEHLEDTDNPHAVTKSDVGLGNADNTSDLNKPVSTATQTALDGKSDAGHSHTVTKSDVGLGNADNTSDLNKPVSTATQTALDLKAALASPAFTGTPSVPTATLGTNTTQVASTAFVKAAVDALIAAAPGALDTLDELAAALGDDANFAGTMTTALAGKEPSQTAASQAEMEAGTSTSTRSFTPERIRQAQAKSQTVTLASLATATDAGSLPLLNEIRVSLTGDLTLLAPTSPQAVQKIIYLLTASGGARTLTLNASIKTPTGTSFSGAIASGSTRFLELTYIANRWAVTSNLEFVA